MVEKKTDKTEIIQPASKQPANKVKLFSLDKFIQTAKSMPKYSQVTDIQYAGFIRLMETQDRQFSLEGGADYVKDLDAYLGL